MAVAYLVLNSTSHNSVHSSEFTLLAQLCERSQNPVLEIVEQK